MKDQTLYIFTLAYPYGVGETFFEPELGKLSTKFKQIILVPLSKRTGIRTLPENVEVLDILTSDWQKASPMKGWFSAYLSVFFKRFPKALKNARTMHSLLKNNAKRAAVFANYIEGKGANVLFYSYWMSDSATMLSLLKKKGVVSSFITRVHGFDLYDERHEFGFQPFHPFVLKQTNAVLTVSEVGRDYLISRFGYEEKISGNYLGTIDHGIGPIPKDDVFRIVSCSNIIALKRVDLIFKALEDVGLSIEWTHFGDGEGKSALDKLIGNSSGKPIKINLMGRVDHHVLVDFYANNPVDIFINLSATEGLPVTIMEAISFGIPVIATNVGGTKEIVGKRTGILLSDNPELKAVKLAIHELLKITRDESFRQSIRSFWKNKFHIEKSVDQLSDQLKKLF